MSTLRPIFLGLSVLSCLSCQDAWEKQRLAAQAQFKAGEYALALTTLKDVIAARPQDAESLYLAGLASFEAGQEALAMDYFSQVVALKPDHVQARLEWALMLARKQQWDQALALIHEVLAVEPKNIFAIHRAIEIQLKRGDLQQAREMLDKAQLLGLRNVNTEFLEGQWLLAKGQWQDAERHFAAAAQKYSDQDFLHYYRACALVAQGQTESGLDALTKAFSRGQGNAASLWTQPEFKALLEHPRFVALAGPRPAP